MKAKTCKHELDHSQLSSLSTVCKHCHAWIEAVECPACEGCGVKEDTMDDCPKCKGTGAKKWRKA